MLFLQMVRQIFLQANSLELVVLTLVKWYHVLLPLLAFLSLTDFIGTYSVALMWSK